MIELLEFPRNIEPSTMEVKLVSNTKSSTSMFNGSELDARFLGDRWLFTLNFSNLDYEIDILMPFLFQLGGKAGRTKLYPFHRKGGPARGQPKVSGSNNTGGLLSSKGWLPNTVVLNRGQFVSINGELKMITKDVVSDGVGNAVISFSPWLRQKPPADSEIVTDKPTGVFKLDDDTVGISLEPQNGNVSVSFREVFYV